MSAWSRERVLRFLKRALPVSAALVVAPLALTSWVESSAPGTAPPQDAASSPPVTPVAAAPAAGGVAATVEPDRVHTLRAGDTLGRALRALGLAGDEAERAANAASVYVNPKQLRPGMRIAAFVSSFSGGDGASAPRAATTSGSSYASQTAQPTRFELAVAGRGHLSVERGGEEWLPSWRPYRRELRTRAVHGSLSGSLESSVAAAGAHSDLAYAMADVLQWDLDFNRDLQPGDRFDVLFEEVHLEGSYFGVERVLALSYAQANRKLEVFRFGSAGAFYDAEGRPSEKMFLRAPLPYSRVTSKFSTRRFHPVLKIHRPHYGVDYGAPVGTPVRVTAAGTVLHAGWEGGGGKTVKVRHPNGFVTCYLHLSGFAAGVRAGSRVRQGELIGYVGATGLASGPHLDYRVQRNGTWIDPQSLKSVPGPALDTLQLADFRVVRDVMRPMLAGTAEPPAAGADAFLLAAARAGAPGQSSGARDARDGDKPRTARATDSTTRK
jgi:murein DD-endopeptidase MepM/ murein hydrolase activator NlpD